MCFPQHITLNRRRFLQLSAAGLAAGAFVIGERESNREVPYKVLWNDDTTNIPKWTPGEVFQDDQLRGAINSVADKGIDAYMLSPGCGWIPWWKSKVYPDHYQWRLEEFGVKPDCFGKYMMAGGDLVRTLIEHCRKRNLAPFVSFRLNDNHFQEQRHSVWVSRFYEEHPEYLLNPKHYEIEGYSKERGQNWAIPAVREYKLALIRELCANYDLDGLELDFLRDDTLFRQNETTEEQRAAWVAEFVRAVRAVLDAGPNKNHRRYLCVRIPCEIAKHGRSGINVERFAEAGVDMFNLSNWYHTAQCTDLAEVRSLVPQAAVYMEMHYVTANKMPKGYSAAAFPKTSNEQFYTTADLAYARGGWGQLFQHAVQQAFLCGPAADYAAGVVGRTTPILLLGQCPLLPAGARHSRGSKESQFETRHAPPPRSQRNRSRLRVHADVPLSGVNLEVAINGQKLIPTNDVGAFFGNPYDGMISEPPNRLAYTAANMEFNNGLNDVSLSLMSGEDVKVSFIDLMLEKQPSEA